MGVTPFRVKRVPDPKVMVGNSEGPAISAGTLRASVGILAMADNFPFQVNYQVRGFEVSLKKSTAAQLQTAINQGPGFSGEVKSILNQASKGDKVYFENIKVLAPDGTTRTSSLTYTVL